MLIILQYSVSLLSVTGSVVSIDNASIITELFVECAFETVPHLKQLEQLMVSLATSTAPTDINLFTK
jgi:hypothetical protein